jgi:DNA-binding GntR family transcriptional regulator
MPLAPLSAEPDLVERAHGAILRSISEGELAPGTRLTQEELAASLGVSTPAAAASWWRRSPPN